jgi:hypothetical protein
MYNQNIKVKYNKIKSYKDSSLINVVTFYKKNESNEIINILQKKCINENLNNKNVSEVHILGKNLENEFSNHDIQQTIKNTNKKVIYKECENNVTFKDLIDYIDENLKNKIICILRSDIILPNQKELDELFMDLIINNNIYVLSRIERLINGNFARSENLNKNMYSTEQDAWIFKSPLHLIYENNNFSNLYFYDKYSELYFNKILLNNEYNIINDTTKYKIIRLLYENNIDNRLLIEEADDIDEDSDIFLLPDNAQLNKVSIDTMIAHLKISDKDLYKIRCEIYNKYFKNIIIDNI